MTTDPKCFKKYDSNPETYPETCGKEGEGVVKLVQEAGLPKCFKLLEGIPGTFQLPGSFLLVRDLRKDFERWL